MVPMMAQGTPAGGDLTGAVMDDAGRPRPGVNVWLSAGPARRVSAGAARASTDARGRFTLTVPALPPARLSNEPLSVWAHEAGMVPARLGVPWATSIGREEVELTLVPAQGRTITLLGPDGKPAANARVVPGSFSPAPEDIARTFLSVPDELAERLGATTSASGEVVLAYVTPEHQVQLEVAADGLGTQWFYSIETPERPITLRPVGRVAGRVEADDPEAVRGVVIELWTKIGGHQCDSNGAGGCAGRAQAQTDDLGRFEVPALAAGVVTIQVNVPGAWPYRAAAMSLQPIEEGGESRAEVVLTRAVRLKGTARERGTGQPVAGAWVVMRGSLQGELVSSDVEGHFEGLVLPGPIAAYVLPWDTPRPFFAPPGEPPENAPEGVPFPDVHGADVPGDVPDFTLPAFELVRGDDVPGTVVDAEGRPVPAARVEARELCRGSWSSKLRRRPTPRADSSSRRSPSRDKSCSSKHTRPRHVPTASPRCHHRPLLRSSCRSVPRTW